VLAVAAGLAGELYEQALGALVDALGEAGDEHWQAWLREDVELWRTSRRTDHHRRAFGGMGSFNDRWMLGDIWVETSIAQLAHITGLTAAEPPERFVQVHGIFTHDVRLHLRRCCGQEFVRAADLTNVAATAWASWAIPRMVTDGTTTAREPYVHFVELQAQGVEPCTTFEAACQACGGTQWTNSLVTVW
jgi:hypothetical protein